MEANKEDPLSSLRHAEIGRARTHLGFAPQVGLEDGLSRTVAWYREQGASRDAQPGR